MTRRRHLKDLVRARMARTGESYTGARSQLARRSRARVASTPFVVVPVAEIARATRFYTEALMLPLQSASATWTVVGHDDERVALEPGGTTGVDLGIGLRVPDLASTLGRVVAAGGAVIEHDHQFARVTDPDGNVLRVMSQPAARS